MIILRTKNHLPLEAVAHLKEQLSKAFPGEKVLVLPEDFSIEFVNGSMKRCSYCSTLQDEKNSKCHACGAVL